MKNRLFGIFIMATLMVASFAPADAPPVRNEPRVFKNWTDCFRFMADACQCVFTRDADSLFKLAAESSMEWFWLEEGSSQVVIVIKLDMLSGPYSAIRGAQGNGPYYLFTPAEEGFRFVGAMDGNRFRWGTRNGRARFTTNWHMSATQSIENIYDWDGVMFRQTSAILYEYDPADGSRKEVKTLDLAPPAEQPRTQP